MLAAGAGLGWLGHEATCAGEEPDLRRYREVRDFVRSTFVREVTSMELLDQALRGMVEELDEYSRYYDMEELSRLERETTGYYRGIGVVFTRPTSDGRILFPLPESPADRAGLEVGDRILRIQGEWVAEMAPGRLVEALSDQNRGTLDLLVESRGGERREVRIQREELIDPTVRHARAIQPGNIGYLAITSFSEQTPEEMDHAVEALWEQGVRSLVIDLRGNVGGVLSSAVRIANRFIAEGLIVSTEGRGRPVLYEGDPREARLKDTPLVVLVDEDSASASEVLAAALQDRRAAVIAGSPTYGKGMVQTMKEFRDDPQAVVKLTSSYYYTPGHRNFERTVADAWESGITPDLAVDLTPAERRRVHGFLARYSPPPDSFTAIRSWEREEGTRLLDAPPPDAQLDAALELLRGKRPGPCRTTPVD
jgi:carboxyl-terminal processing protease